MSALRPTDRPEKSGSAEFPAAFGRFVLLRRLSRGGMGEIFLAKIGEIVGFEKFVIIKKILPQLAANDDFIVRFIDEAQVAIKLNHVNIAQVFEVGRVDGEYFLAIEYVDGRDVRRLMRRCRELQGSAAGGSVSAHCSRSRRWDWPMHTVAPSPKGRRWRWFTATSRHRMSWCRTKARSRSLTLASLARRCARRTRIPTLALASSATWRPSS
jgi:hypothetical protein